MTTLDIIRTYIEYHIATTRRVWDSIDRISEEQFLADDAYSRGSIRNLMVHLASTDRRWLTALKNRPDVGHLNFEDYSTPSAARRVFESVAENMTEYVNGLSEDELMQNATGSPGPRWQILLHLVNHGTDHRSTVLQKLAEHRAPTFEQDLVFWLWSK
jgi:uncharacterized damage-inducible protein DinB